MLNRIIFLMVILIISILSAGAAVTDLQISPANPVVGDTITIRGVASPGESINAGVSFTKSVPVSGGFYSYNINGVEIPSGSNSFTVTATGVKDLYVDIKMSIWWSKSIPAIGTIATLSESDLPAGTYDVKIYGLPASGVSIVSLQIDAAKMIVADTDGNFEYSYSTSALPVGDFSVLVGGESRIITLQAPVQQSSSGGGTGGGGTGEANANIECFEIDRQFISKNTAIEYIFSSDCIIVDHIRFTGLTTSGDIVGKVEILKNTSTLVTVEPPGIVFKNLNIWFGFAGWATETNMADATVNFRVDRSWITENAVDPSSITLYRYSDGKWNTLVTIETRQDQDNYYFTADTPGFSPFAISGQERQLVQATVSPMPPETRVNTSSENPIPASRRAMPGFGIFITVISLFIIIFIKRE